MKSGPDCTFCDAPYEVHAEAFGLPPGHLSNCAQNLGDAPGRCSVCRGVCPGAHAYTPPPIGTFRGDYAFLSNFHLAPVQIYGWTFPSVEHAFQAMKSAHPAQDWPWFVNPAVSPGDAKRKGKVLLLRADWERVKFDFMQVLVMDKFTRHGALAQKLVETEPARLIEGNTWHDNIWGDCHCGRAACAFTGENMLGIILMRVRGHLGLRATPVDPGNMDPLDASDIPF